MTMQKIIAWWSAGATSAVSVKLAIDEFGVDNVIPIYFAIDTAHKDNSRFKSECEDWYGCEIQVRRSPKYKDQFDVVEKTKYLNGPAGARCTTELKKKVRQSVEKEFEFGGQIFGFEYNPKEINRAIRFKEQNPSAKPIFPLIENKITKPECLHLLQQVNIDIPTMYTLGYSNNNCIGCVKGGIGYWNKIRVDFPEVFEKMALLERKLDRTCQKNREFLDEIDPSRGHEQKIIMPDCGNFCDIEFQHINHPQLNLLLENPELMRSL